jgi:UDP-glucuronate 4-epimerase
MTKLSGRRVLVTGASGVVAYPVAVELAKANEVFAVARFLRPRAEPQPKAGRSSI